MKYLSLLFTLSIITFHTLAQDKPSLPYYEIPDYPESYTAETVAARMIDGLGFRYYWATEGLRPEDLEYRPNDMARSTGETIDHILGLTNMVVKATTKQINGGKVDKQELTFDEIRRRTLENLKTASDILKSSNSEGLEDFKIRYDNGKEIPFWNMINGPIADATWHVGQVVSFRRSSGNPFNSKASVFTGKVSE